MGVHMRIANLKKLTPKQRAQHNKRLRAVTAGIHLLSWEFWKVKGTNDYVCEAKDARGLLVDATTVEVAEGILSGETCPQYHISISKRIGSLPCRCSAEDGAWVIQHFGLPAALEDNHGPLVRSFWQPVAEKLIGVDCECKGEEAPITEGDFTWRPLTQDNADRQRLLPKE